MTASRDIAVVVHRVWHTDALPKRPISQLSRWHGLCSEDHVVIKHRAAVGGLGVLLVLLLACSGKAGSDTTDSGSGSNPGDSTPGLGGSGSSGGSGSGGSSGSGSGSGGLASSSGPSDFACGTDSGSALADEAGLPPEAGGGSEHLGGGCCSSALHVSVGGTVHGSTCGGPPSPSGTDFCVGGHPDAYIYVDAPAGTQLEVSASTGVSIVVFPDCTPAAAKQEECLYGLGSNATAGFVVSDVAARLFLVEHQDVDCGDFTFHAGSAGSATEAEAGTGATSDAGGE